MILFPRREGKPKKGIINDSTAEKLKSAEAENQNLSNHVIDRPAKVMKEKAQKITQQLKDLKVYRKLRQERVNAQYIGKREKRAKEKKEEQQ